jgi:kynurenine formamidase
MHISELLRDAPRNWGKWGPEDEVGALNYLDAAAVLRGAACIRAGKTFTLGIPMANPAGDPLWPGRLPAQRYNVLDRGDFVTGGGPDIPGGNEYADDIMVIYNQGSSQVDALGHVWYDGELYNGYPAETTARILDRASILPIAERGITGRGVLIDMARHRGKEVLDKGETFTHDDIVAAAAAQGVELGKRDILVIRTGFIGSFWRDGAEEFYRDFCEPGLVYSPELVRWFQEMEIPALVTDTIANEVTVDPGTGISLPLHSALMRNLGIVFSEIMQLDALAADCAEDGQYDFLFTVAPLKVTGGTGAPANPVVVK